MLVLSRKNRESVVVGGADGLHRLLRVKVLEICGENADRVDTLKLQELMRHSNIETTRWFYVGRNAQNTAAALWSARDRATGTAPEVADRNTIDNKRPDEEIPSDQETTQALEV